VAAQLAAEFDRIKNPETHRVYVNALCHRMDVDRVYQQ
jgi:hypothetical protein